MGTGRTLNKKPITRPKKSEGNRRRRQRAQKLRLARLLGLDPKVAAKMEPVVVRNMLKYPKSTLAALAVAKSSK